jgi:hypothetical protein
MLQRMMMFCILLSTLVLTGCGPQYKTFSHYQTPSTEEGKNCAFQCESERNSCQSQCNNTYQVCRQNAKIEGKSDFLNAKESWLMEQEHCLHMDKKQARKAGCNNNNKPYKSEFVNTSGCSKNCGCGTGFDRCFQLCGGQISHETRCVSGCDK